VSAGFQDGDQRIRGGGIALADLADRGQKRVHGLVGALELRVPPLVNAGAEQRLEQRAPLRGEANVGTSHRGQPLLRGLRVDGLGFQHRSENVQGADRDRSEEVVAVGEVSVRGCRGDADPSARFGERESTDPTFCDQLDCGVDERRAEVAVVVAASLAGPVRWRR
jgi:hypothetical protein